MIITLDVPDQIVEDAEKQFGGQKLADRLKKEIVRWAEEFRERDARKNLIYEKTDFEEFLNG